MSRGVGRRRAWLRSDPARVPAAQAEAGGSSSDRTPSLGTSLHRPRVWPEKKKKEKERKGKENDKQDILGGVEEREPSWERKLGQALAEGQ